ncbi:rCG30828 [Rattus norvegicus]|uniref:RCG30828 n=1 Tax=Rattus norvegicus TaxID=10116 RepID=A6ITD5_RAT|nr:rCG30828 [Rattus norvegicus]
MLRSFLPSASSVSWPGRGPCLVFTALRVDPPLTSPGREVHFRFFWAVPSPKPGVFCRIGASQHLLSLDP